MLTSDVTKNVKLNLNKDYICEDEILCRQLDNLITNPDYKAILLTSPQNTGKSKYFVRIKDRMGHVSLLLPTTLLAEQQAKDYDRQFLQGITESYYGGEEFSMTATNGNEYYLV